MVKQRFGHSARARQIDHRSSGKALLSEQAGRGLQDGGPLELECRGFASGHLLL